MTTINTILQMLIAICLVVLGFFLMPLAGFAGGAFTGLVVNWVFPETMVSLVDLITQGRNLEPWQIGGMLGFVTAFLKQDTSNKQ